MGNGPDASDAGLAPLALFPLKVDVDVAIRAACPFCPFCLSQPPLSQSRNLGVSGLAL